MHTHGNTHKQKCYRGLMIKYHKGVVYVVRTAHKFKIIMSSDEEYNDEVEEVPKVQRTKTAPGAGQADAMSKILGYVLAVYTSPLRVHCLCFFFFHFLPSFFFPFLTPLL